MKIALLTDGIWPHVIGGMQKHSYYLCKYLSRSGVQVDLYHTKINNELSDLAEFTELEKTNIKSIVVDFPKKRSVLPGHYIRRLKRYSKKLLQNYKNQQEQVDFIIAKSLTGFAFMEAKGNGEQLPPLGINIHGYEMFQLAPNLKTRLSGLLLRPSFRYINHKADYVFSYGGHITDIIKNKLHVPESKIIEIPTGIDEDWLQQSNLKVNQPIRFVYLGRYERRKGIEEINQVLKSIKINNFVFEFIGNIPIQKRIKKESIIYHGLVRDKKLIRGILQNADILVAPSYSEGMPNVIMEAMASGCAIIATDVGAVSEQVSKENGWLIPPKSTMALQLAIKNALYMPQGELIALKTNSIEKVKEKFLWEKIIEQYIDKICAINKKYSPY